MSSVALAKLEGRANKIVGANGESDCALPKLKAKEGYLFNKKEVRICSYRILQFYFHTPLISFNFFSLDQPLI